MPNMNGQTATRKIREMGYRGIIIGVTGDVMDDEIQDFKASGANAVLEKPLDMNKFSRIVQEHILCGIPR